MLERFNLRQLLLDGAFELQYVRLQALEVQSSVFLLHLLLQLYCQVCLLSFYLLDLLVQSCPGCLGTWSAGLISLDCSELLLFGLQL